MNGTDADPLTILVRIANDESEPTPLRAQCASWAAPYLFPRLSAAVVATATMDAKDDNAALVSRLYERFQRIAAAQQATIEGKSEAVAS